MKKILIFICLIAIFTTCSCKNNQNDDGYKYTINQDTFYGVGDVLVYDNCSRESIDARIDLMKKMGFKSHRFWLRIGRSNNAYNRDCLFRIENNELVVNDNYYEDTKYAISKLIEAGITHITLCASWMYGKEDGKYVYYGGEMPSPKDDRYSSFMDTVYDIYKRIASLYKEIQYIEMGNEYNANFLSFDGTTKVVLDLKSQFILDFSYYATKGIHDGNSNAKSVLNGVLDLEWVPTDEREKYFFEDTGKQALIRLFDDLYTKIESGTYPSVGSSKSTKPDDYFEVICYHPYKVTDEETWVEYNNDVYDIIIKHGDQGKPVFITEWGMTRINGESGEVYKQIVLNKELTPFIEAVHYYILTDNVEFDQYCLSYLGESGEYVLTSNGQVLYDAFGTK